MTTLPHLRGRATTLTGRDKERDVLDRLVEAVRAGESRALAVRGEPGVGKTALLDYLAERASGCRVVRAAGVQSENDEVFGQLLITPIGVPAPTWATEAGLWPGGPVGGF